MTKTPHSPADNDMSDTPRGIAASPIDAQIKGIRDALDIMAKLSPEKILSLINTEEAGASLARLIDCVSAKRETGTTPNNADTHDAASTCRNPANTSTSLDLSSRVIVTKQECLNVSVDAMRNQMPATTHVFAESGLDLFELSGTVRWYDPGKGYGIIAPDLNLPTIFLTTACLHASGRETTYAGHRILCEAVQKPGGFQAFRVLHLDDTGANIVSQANTDQLSADTAPPEWERAKVRWFDRASGQALLAGSSASDIFVPESVFLRSNLRTLSADQIVYVKYLPGSPDRIATELSLSSPKTRS